MTEITESFSSATHDAHAFTAIFLHDWRDVTMIHFEIDPRQLQPMVPFDLHTYRGRAYVTLVFFRLECMRTPVCRWLSRQAFRPISDHRFLNVRTYVRHQAEPGIYFLTEWLESRLAVMLGPLTYGLPYRLARFKDSTVTTPFGHLSYQTKTSTRPYAPSQPGSFDEFLFERYTAFTQLRGKPHLFRIRHEPWRQRRVDVELTDTALLKNTEPWFPYAKLSCAHQGPGLVGVELSRPLKPGSPRDQGDR